MSKQECPVSRLSFVFVDGMFKIFSERVSFCTGEKHFFLMFEFSIFNLASGGGGGGDREFCFGRGKQSLYGRSSYLHVQNEKSLPVA